MPQGSSMKSKQTVFDRYDQAADIIMLSDSSETLVKKIPEKTINLIISSPPYNLGKEYEKHDEIDNYLSIQKALIGELYRLLADNGSICWQVGNYVKNNEVLPLDILFYDIFKELKMFLRNRIIWRFGHGLNSTKRFSGRYETILWFTKSQDYKFNLDPVRIRARYPNKRHTKGPKKGELSGNPKGKNPSDIWDIILKDWQSGVWEIPNVKANHSEKTIHPCQFPVELAERCVLALTDPGDTVFDPYMGVGSSILAAIMHDRKAIGCDRENKYVKIAKQRINDYFNGSLKTRPLGKPIFDPKMAGVVAKVPDIWVNQKDSIYNTTTELA